MLNLKELSLEELENLKKAINEEINKRENEKIIYNTDFRHENSACKRWAKELSDIDDTKTNGYAFVGDWLKNGDDTENLVTRNAYIIECISHNKRITYTLYKALDNKQKEVILKDDGTNFITFIKEIKEILKK